MHKLFDITGCIWYKIVLFAEIQSIKERREDD